ncbi:leucine-rich repeat-containing protein 45-like [Gigantopelta aegis]|uniref:leucine-rich repeat-containing protein 45-like n=1 Tax=Gigantopelta aegis TaxID=1735272 RepID=UPI001B88D1CB|nr:leucine-rich repeat-containing protein 45-like [Gigantopelta aegis]
MEEFKHTFVRLCKDNHVDVQDCVTDKLKSFSSGSGKEKTVLDLSANSLTAKTCAVLGKVLSLDRTFLEVKFADCMLNEDAIKGLCHGFSINSFCKKLDLKGNNIRGSGAEALGKMLQKNHTLVSLCLEWNALGLLDNSFAVFCDAIGCNRNLQALDLRNNQINHDEAAELATNLKRNTYLKALDLRWNNIGLLGGRALIEMLKTNKTLSRLELAGNNIPSDVLKSIETAISNNADRQLLTNEHTKRTQTLTKHIKQIEVQKCAQLSDLMNTLDNQEDLLRKTKRSSTQKVSHLQEALEDRKSAFNSLASKLSMTESELVLAEQKLHDQDSVIARLKQEMSDMAVAHLNEMRREKEDRATEEMKLLRELSESNDKNIQLEIKSEDLDRKCKNQQEQIYELKEQITHLQAELKLKSSQFDERIQQEKIRQKEAIRDVEQYKQKEIIRVKQEADDLEKTLRDRIHKMEAHQLDLDEEISRLKATIMSDKMIAEEQLVHAKQKIKTEEEQRQKQLEEKVRVLQITKDDLQSHCNQQASLVSELQCKNSNLTLEGDTLKRRLEEMGQELAEKNNVTIAEVNKVKLELTATLNKLESERQLQSELRNKLSQVDRDISEQLLRHRQVVEEKDREIVSLSERIRALEYEVSRIRDDESQRAQILQSAILNYVAKVPPAAPLK